MYQVQQRESSVEGLSFLLEHPSHVGEHGLGLLQVLHGDRAQDGVVGLIVEGETGVGVEVPYLR